MKLTDVALTICNLGSLIVNNVNQQTIEKMSGKKPWEIRKDISNIRNLIYLKRRCIK